MPSSDISLSFKRLRCGIAYEIQMGGDRHWKAFLLKWRNKSEYECEAGAASASTRAAKQQQQQSVDVSSRHGPAFLKGGTKASAIDLIHEHAKVWNSNDRVRI